MTNEEAIARIRDHKIVHKMNEPRAIYISEALNMAIKALEQQPKTGRWIATENEEMNIDGYFCSCCDLPMETEERTKYCPNCGAKMKAEREEE